jgi:hypothetical protein
VEWNIGLQGYGEAFLPITDFFNTHGILRQQSRRSPRGSGFRG